MNISRKVLDSRRVPLNAYLQSGLDTWSDRESYTWFGNRWHSVAYFYFDPKGIGHYYMPYHVDWLRLDLLPNHPWSPIL